MAETLADIFAAAREGRNPTPEMIGEELARARVNLANYYATWQAAAPAFGVTPPSGPDWEWLAVSAVGALPGLLATIAMQNEALARIERREEPTEAEVRLHWQGPDAVHIARMARLLAGTEEG